MNPNKKPAQEQTKKGVSYQFVNTDSLVGKYLEVSGEMLGLIELDTGKDILVRKAIVIKEHVGLCEQAVYVSKSVLDDYWVKLIELPTIPETINSVNSANLIREYLNM